MANPSDPDPNGGNLTGNPDGGNATGAEEMVWAGHPFVPEQASAGGATRGAGNDRERGGAGSSPSTDLAAPVYNAAKARLVATLADVSNIFLKLVGIILTPTFLVIVFVVLAAFFVSNVASDSTRLTSVEYARGLITLLFSVGTLAIAVLLTISVLFPGTDAASAKATFDQGKEVLTLLIGIFGTILGFYFGTLKDQAERGKVLTAIEGRGGEVSGKTVYLDRPSVTDDDLILLRRLPSIERLFLDTSSVTDNGLRYLRDITTLKFVSLRGATKVTGTALSDLQKAMGSGFQVVPAPNELETPKPAQPAPATPVPGNAAPKDAVPKKLE